MKLTVTTTSILVLVFLLGGYYFFKRDASTVSLPVDISIGQSLTIPVTQAPDGRYRYQNEKYHFSLFYAEEMVVKEYNEGAGAVTIIFQNPEKGMGFQIFVVPYAEKQISAERFKRDIPTGVRTNLTDVTIDGATGASFYSKDLLLGDTAEVWFVNGGFLYEVTTLRTLDQWLSGIMLTWRFL